MLNHKSLKHFFALVKSKQKPYEDALIAVMQGKVDTIKRQSTYTLNDSQKKALERDKALIEATEGYVSIQHEIITHLFKKLEETTLEIEALQTEVAAKFSDKLEAEKALRDYIEKDNEREIHSAD